MTPLFTDVAGAKKYLCCGTTRLYQLINNKEIQRVKAGSKSLIVVESLARYADSLMEKAA